MSVYRSPGARPPRDASLLDALEGELARLAAQGKASRLFGGARLSARASRLAGAAVSGWPTAATSCDAIALTSFRCGERDGLLAVIGAGNYKDEGCGAASGAAVHAFVSAFAASLPEWVDIAPALRRAVLATHDAVLEISASPLGDRRIFTVMGPRTNLRGIGVCVTAAAVTADRVVVAHVGDGAAYLVRGGVARKLTIEHTLGNNPKMRAEISKGAGPAPDLDWMKGVVLRALGTATECPAFDVSRADLGPGDRLVLANAALDGAPWPEMFAEAATSAADATADALAREMSIQRRWAPSTLAVLDVVA